MSYNKCGRFVDGAYHSLSIDTSWYQLCRGEADICAVEGKDYSGIQFRWSFKGEVPVDICALGFFGPHHSSTGPFDYEISIEIIDSLINYKSGDLVQYMPQKKWKTVTAVGEKLLVTLPSPVKIPKDTWVDVKFELKGPKTYFIKQEQLYQVSSTGFEIENCKFVSIIGSGQMPDIFFKI